MTARFMLDTNIIIYLRTGRSRPVEERIVQLVPGEAVMSVVTYGELVYGAEKSTAREAALARLKQMVAIVAVEDLPRSAGIAYGAIRVDLGRRGELIGPNDLWIAAHARAADLTLVTNNEREFRRVPGLKVENWATA